MSSAIRTLSQREGMICLRNVNWPMAGALALVAVALLFTIIGVVEHTQHLDALALQGMGR